MANLKGWVRVRQGSPCPICNSPDWCSVTADGAVAKCMRSEGGSYCTKLDRNGAPSHLHRLDGRTARGTPAVESPTGLPPARADPDTLHEIYSAILAGLPLHQRHRNNLSQRGLPDDRIDEGGYGTLPQQGRSRLVAGLAERFGERLVRVPGIVLREGNSGRYRTLAGPVGLLIPVRDRVGHIVALKVRRDTADDHTRRYVYLSSADQGGAGSGSPLHVPLGTPENCENVRLVEGELKADICWAITGRPTLSVPGVTNWRPALSELQALGAKTVCLTFDADARENRNVAKALEACAGALVAAGHGLELERWELSDGKGLDDLLAAGKLPQILTGEVALAAAREAMAEATADDDPAEDWRADLDRLHAVLDAGGAESLFRDNELLQALARLCATSPAEYAAVRASLQKTVRLRDLDKALRPFLPRPGEGTGEQPATYFEERGRTYRNVQTKDGTVPVPLANFTARIVEDVVHDDGAEQTGFLAIQGQLGSGQPLPRYEVPAADFGAMGWVVPAWGTRAVVFAGQGTKDHLRAAIQILSGDVPRRTVYRHVGWKKINDRWCYLHAGGAISADGLLADVPVALPESLSGFDLPAPPDGTEARAAICASLRMLKVGPDSLTFPLLAAVYRAALGHTDFALHLAGRTGTFKSEVAALAQQHFGAGLDARHLPANWSSTGNALEGLAFAAKDTLLVVDDFCPVGSSADVQRYHREADRLFRGQGNRAGRARMRADATLRPSKPPRGLVLSTGEDSPRGSSLRARAMILEVSPGDFGPEAPDANPTLTACQADARSGKYASAMAGFLRYLASRYEVIRTRLRQEVVELRDMARASGQHARTPGIVADLGIGLRYLLAYAGDVGAITLVEQRTLWERGWKALQAAGAAQAAQIQTSEPAGLFLRLVQAVIASGQAHLANLDGNEPPDPQRWGWTAEEYYAGKDSGPGIRYRGQGPCIGWLTDGQVYLEPEASYAAAQRLAQAQGEAFPITATTLRRRLKERKFLMSTDEARGKLTVRKTLQNQRRDVLHIAWPGGIHLAGTGHTGQSGQGESWANEGADSPDEEGGPAHSSAQANVRNAVENEAVGRLGRSDASGACVVGDDPNPEWSNWQ